VLSTACLGPLLRNYRELTLLFPSQDRKEDVKRASRSLAIIRNALDRRQ
jgi:hypothetical protein